MMEVLEEISRFFVKIFSIPSVILQVTKWLLFSNIILLPLGEFNWIGDYLSENHIDKSISNVYYIITRAKYKNELEVFEEKKMLTIDRKKSKGLDR